MSAVNFSVSTKFLDFSKNKISTQEIQIKGEIGIFLKMTHNLPSCFTLDPPCHDFMCPGRLTVTYNSFADDQKEKNPLKINFINPNSQEVVTVLLELVDEEEQKSKDLECKICTQQFDEDNRAPKILSRCGHTVCAECVKELSGSSPPLTVRCPYDRIISNIGDFKKNFFIIDMIQEKKALDEKKKSMETKECEDPFVPCFEHSNHESTSFCTNCEVDFCRNCFNNTHSSRVLSGHKAIPINEKPIIVPACPRHPDKKAFYVYKHPRCQDHNQVKIFCDQCLSDSRIHNFNKKYMETAEENKLELENFFMEIEIIQRKFKENNAKLKDSLLSYSKTGRIYQRRVIEIRRKCGMKKKWKMLEDLDRHVEDETKIFKESIEQNERDWNLLEKLKGEIERKLKRKTDLHCVEDLMKRRSMLEMFDVTASKKFQTFADYLTEMSKLESPFDSVANSEYRGPMRYHEVLLDDEEDEEGIYAPAPARRAPPRRQRIRKANKY